MTINIGDNVKTRWGNGIVTRIYKENGFGRTGLSLLMDCVDVEIDGTVRPMYRHHIINPDTGDYYDQH